MCQGGTADRDANRDFPDEEPKVKPEGTSSTTALPAQKTSKKKTSNASWKKFKAPAHSDSDSSGEIAAIWADNHLEEEENQHISGSRKVPVTPPPETTNKLEALKAILYLLKEAGVTPGPFAAKDMFDLDLETIQNTQSELFEN
ncbi:hypothetical protein PInf_022798 [Phytophthora infestans]|nr:hypothetical protein PInf_022798 [Phytophthora infestans]